MSFFWQARILLAPEFVAADDNQQDTVINDAEANPPGPVPELENTIKEGQSVQGVAPNIMECGLSDDLRAGDLEEDGHVPDGDNTSCLATCATSDMEEDPFKSYAYEAEEGQNQGLGPLTSCVGTRWFRAPELLYGSTTYGTEIDLWSLGCIFAEMLNLEPLFPGASDIDQIGRIFSVLGNLSRDAWPGCVELPDYNIISFGQVENPLGLESCLPNRSADEIILVKKLVCYNPANRATAMELLQDKYFNEEPLPIPISQLRVPSKHCAAYEDFPDKLGDYKDFSSDSDFDDFGPTSFTRTDFGYAIQFS